MTPIYQTSTYAQESPGKHRGYEYSRTDNPTRTAYQSCVAALEGGKHALAFSSGLATTDAILHTLKPGDHVICCDDVYGGTFRIFDKVYRRLGIDFSFVDFSDLKKTEASFRPNTKLLWMETPTNPMLKILDIAALAALAKRKNVVSVVDNTFMSSYFQKPLQLGADIVVHSVTKYMNGHSDVVGGSPGDEQHRSLHRSEVFSECSRCCSRSDGLLPGHARLKDPSRQNGKTRPKRDGAGSFLESHSKIDKVIYPGLESHPQHALARKQMSGFGGMITFFVKGGLSEARTFLEKVRIFTLAESLGGVESLIEHPAIMTHASIPAENRKMLGIHDNLIRISVGIEDISDLIEDLAQALG